MYLHYWDRLDLPSDVKAHLWRPGFCVCVLQQGHRLAGQPAVPPPPPGSSQRTASPATAQQSTIRTTFLIPSKHPAKLQIRCWCLNSAVNFVTDHSFVVVISLWVDTHNHPDFAFSIKVVFKQMCNFRVPVWHHLEGNKASVKLFPQFKIIHDKSEQQFNVMTRLWNTNPISSTHLVFTQDFHACAQCHQGLVNIPC